MDIYNTDEYVNYPDDECVASTVIDVNTVKRRNENAW